MWCYCVKDLIDIEVSPKNELFSYIDNKYLVGKSNPSKNVFDILYFARIDIEEAVIPPQIEILFNNSFCNHKKLRTVICPKNSKLKRIEKNSFYNSTISKIVLPETIEYICCDIFCDMETLNEIEISPKNKLFSVIGKTLFVTKSDKSCKDFDILIFFRRDAENVKIPSSIKIFNDYSFQCCEKLKELVFEQGSSLETISKSAISYLANISSIIFPPSVKYVNYSGIHNNHDLKSVVFLGEYVKIGSSNFHWCRNGMVISFPNVKKLELDEDSMKLLPKRSKLKIRRGAELIGDEFKKIHSIIEFIEGNEKEQNEQISRLINRIRFLEKRLQKYEDVVPFDLNSKLSEEEIESEMNDKDEDEEPSQ